MSNLIDEITQYGELQANFPYDVVIRHPLADETELMAQLQYSAEFCVTCDLYWVYAHRIFFVSIDCLPTFLPARVTYRKKDKIRFGHDFYVVTKACPLTTQIVENCLDYLAQWIQQNQHLLIDEPSSEPGEILFITDRDIVEM